MNKIIFFRNNNGHIKRFEVSGHTDFDLNGSDVLCAAVSTLVSHTIGSVQEFTDEPCINIVDEDIPKVVFEVSVDDPAPECSMLLEAFSSSVDDLAYSHPDNIKVVYEEI